jgi:aarF domain-containing kinase
MNLQRYIYQSCHEPPCLSKVSRRQPFSSTPRLCFKGASYGAPHRRPPRRLFFLVPLTGLAAVYLSPRPTSLLHNFFSSPTLIPCPPDPAPSTPRSLFIQSPYEHRASLWSRIKQFLRSRVLEPLLTARRFLYLCFLFVPVLVSAPMLLIGAPGSGDPKRKRSRAKPDRRLKRRRVKLGEGEGERWGAVWWYDFMVRQMQRAGPTFIKVIRFVKCFRVLVANLLLFHSWRNGRHQGQICFLRRCVIRWACCILMGNLIPSSIPERLLKRYSEVHF